MFSLVQKIQIADAVEKVLLSFNHVEMPKEKPVFTLHVEGKEPWSFANISPNWTFNDKEPTVSLFNEQQPNE